MKGIDDIIKEDMPEGVTPMGAPAPADADKPEGDEGNEGVQTVESNSAPNLTAPPPTRAGDTVEGQEPAATENNEPQEPEVPKYALNEIFGDLGFETLEQVKEANVAEKIRQAEELAQKNQELAEKANAQLNPWASEEIAELNEFTKATGKYDPTLFNTLKRADIDSMDAVDVLTLQKQATNTDPTLTPQDLRRYVERKYGLIERPFSGDPEDEDALNAHKQAEQNRINDAKIDLKIEAGEARAKLQELKGHIKPVDLSAQQEQVAQQNKEKIEAATKAWAPQIAEVSEKLRQFPVKYTGKDGQEAVVDFQIPQEKLDVYKEQALNTVLSNNIPMDENGRQVAENIVRSYAIVDYFPQMTAKAVNAAVAEATAKLEEEVSNPSGEKLPADPSGKAPPAKPLTGDDLEKQAFEKQLDAMSQRGGGFER